MTLPCLKNWRKKSPRGSKGFSKKESGTDPQSSNWFWRRTMTLTLKLPPDLEKELSTEAARLGLPLAAYALKILSEAKASTRKLQTGAEIMAYWEKEGLVGTRSDIRD